MDLFHAVGGNNTSIPAESYAELCCELFGQFCSALDKDNIDEVPADGVHDALRLVLKSYGVSPNDVANSSLAGKHIAKVQGSLK